MEFGATGAAGVAGLPILENEAASASFLLRGPVRLFMHSVASCASRRLI